LDNLSGWKTAVEQITHWLWDVLMGPLVDQMRQSGQPADYSIETVLIPQGLLGFLPLHAAWTDTLSDSSGGAVDRLYALDVCAWSYAPNARSLLAHESVVGRPLDACAVENPDASLQFAEAEVRWLLTHIPAGQRLDATNATWDNVIAGLRTRSLSHLATHGWSDLNEPLNSRLSLADKDLTLRDIINLAIEDKAPVAVLSACETGIPSQTIPDEVVSIAAGLLQSGLRGVISSLWAVQDASTMLLMCRLYDAWVAQGLPLAHALRQAQLWLRTASRADLAAAFDQVSDLLPPEGRAKYRRAVRETKWGWDDDPPYRHPYYWAAFTFTGT
jgi:CHAT domain-containing protein